MAIQLGDRDFRGQQPTGPVAPPPVTARPAVTQDVAPNQNPGGPADVNTGAPAGQQYAGGEAPGSVRATPQQATADYLNGLSRAQQVAAAGGQNDQQMNDALANRQSALAAEKQQQAADYGNWFNKTMTDLNGKSAQAQQAYQDFRSKVGEKVKDPREQYWGDKSTGSRILSGFAGFASGFGQGLLGKGGNPYLDFLNNEINRNFEAHRKNIDDLYNSQVAAGKINDDAQSRAKFEQEAKLMHYDLSSAHIIPELQAIQSTATGVRQQMLAAQTIQGIEDQKTGLKQTLSHSEAMQAAALLAQQRAQQKEFRDRADNIFGKLVDQGYSAEDARRMTHEQVSSLPGFSPSLAANYAQQNGGVWGARVDKDGNPMLDSSGKPVAGWNFPHTNANGTTNGVPAPTMDEKGNIQVPTVDANGRRLKPEEIQRNADAARRLSVRDVDTGQQRLATNERSIQPYTEHAQAYPEVKRLTDELEKAYNSGDDASYTQAKKALTELAPKLYGYVRGPSGAQAGEGADKEAQLRGTVSGQLPEHALNILAQHPVLAGVLTGGLTTSPGNFLKYGQTPTETGKNQFESFRNHVKGVHENMMNNTFGGGQSAPAKPTVTFTPNKK